MSTFIESLKRLYVAKRINLLKVDEFLILNTITQEEYDYITL